MWVESYGVMPHVYMVTTGPGSKATTSPRAVSCRRTPGRLGPGDGQVVRHLGDRSRLLVGDAGELDRHAGLVPHVELEEHGGEGLDRRGVRELTGVEGPQPRDAADDPARDLGGVEVVRADQHVGL